MNLKIFDVHFSNQLTEHWLLIAGSVLIRGDPLEIFVE